MKKKTKKASAKKKKEINLEPWLKQKIRRISYQWPPLKEAVVKARVSRGKYRCASCLGENFGPKEINRDHIQPVEDPLTGFTTWDNYLNRLFCSADEIQILCKPCHDIKTFRENIIRRSGNTKKEDSGNDI